MSSNSTSGTNSAVSGVLAAYEDKLNKVPTSSVLIQLALMGVVGVLALAGFSLLRPQNSAVYQPRVKYSEDGKAPPRIDKGFFSWVKPLLTTKEDLLMDTIGLDAVCFLRFLRMCRNLFATPFFKDEFSSTRKLIPFHLSRFMAITLLTCAILLPINITYNLLYVSSPSRNSLSMLTIQSVKGSWLWGHVGTTYLITLLVYYFVWTNYAAMVQLRWQWFRSDEYQNSLHARSLLITQVKAPLRTDQGLSTLLTSLSIPYPTTAIHIGRKVGGLPALIEEHNKAVRSLEGVLTTFLRNDAAGRTKRPTLRQGGFGCCGGRTVDAIDTLTEKVRILDERIETTRQQMDLKKPENYGFASFESVPFAHIVAEKLVNKRAKGSRFELAPAPNDIIWPNLILPDGQRRTNKFFGGLLLTVFSFFYILPLVAVSLLANLAALTAYVTWIDDWSTNYPLLLSAFVGIVPPLLAGILQLMLPMFMRGIAAWEGATTHSQVDRTVTSRYSAFLFVLQLFVFSLLGVIVQIISQLVIEVNGKKSIAVIWTYLQTIPDQLYVLSISLLLEWEPDFATLSSQQTWIIQSSYWLTVFPLRGSSALFDMAQVISLLTVWIRTKLFGRTPREIREWTKPPEFDFPVYYANSLLMVAVGFVYAPLAPIVPAFAAVAFIISAAVYKYQLMYVCVSRVETGGRLWRVVINRTLLAVAMMQALMVLTIGLQIGWLYSIALAPTLISVIVFKVFLTKKFDHSFKWFIPSDGEIAEFHLHHADARKNRLEKRFGHPSMGEALFTPMLHKSVQHLLPTIYNGRLGKGQGTVDGKAVAQDTIAGLTFTMMGEHDLTFDREAYLAEREDDTMTVSSAPMYSGAKTPNKEQDSYFNARRQDYLNRGATPQTSDDLPDELLRMPRNGTFDSSTDNLIQRPAYPPQYSSDMPIPPVPRLPTSYSQQSIGSQSAVDAYYGGGEGQDGMELMEQNFGGRRPLLPGMGYGDNNNNNNRNSVARSSSPYGGAGVGAGAGYRNDGFGRGQTPTPSQQASNSYSNPPVRQQPQRLDDYLPPSRPYQQRQYSSSGSTATGGGGAYPPSSRPPARNDQYSSYDGNDGRQPTQLPGQGHAQQHQRQGSQQYYNEGPEEQEGEGGRWNAR